MITTEQLANLLILRVVFHDVPSASRSDGEKTPTLSEVETQVDAARKGLLRKKLITALSSKNAYPVKLDPNLSATVGNQVKALTVRGRKKDRFIVASQIMATDLFSKQTAAVSPGLLCVIEARVDSYASILLMKLERHEGAQLKMSESGGKKTFAMDVLDDLVLTEGTRLFKAALFVRNGSGDSEFSALACDGQLNVSASSDMARFWLRFLGCSFIVDPRIATQRFFDTTVKFVNDAVPDPTIKSDIYDALQSEFKSSKLLFSPNSFIEEHIPDAYHSPLREYLSQAKIPLTAFHKDLSDISRRLKRRSYETRGGALISVPIADAELVTITDSEVVIHDALKRVK